MLLQPERFADQPANAIALHRDPDRPRGDGQPETRALERIPASHGLEERLRVSLPASVHMVELRLVAEALAGAEGERPDRISAMRRQGMRRLRPLARRRLNTLRPFFVAMRARNPCVRLRRTLLG